MAVYVVGYDLHPKAGETYGELIEALKKVGTNWWHHLDSTWIIISTKTAAQIRDELRAHIKSDDELLVIEHKGSAAWTGFNQDGGDWLKANL